MIRILYSIAVIAFAVFAMKTLNSGAKRYREMAKHESKNDNGELSRKYHLRADKQNRRIYYALFIGVALLALGSLID